MRLFGSERQYRDRRRLRRLDLEELEEREGDEQSKTRDPSAGSCSALLSAAARAGVSARTFTSANSFSQRSRLGNHFDFHTAMARRWLRSRQPQCRWPLSQPKTRKCLTYRGPDPPPSGSASGMSPSAIAPASHAKIAGPPIKEPQVVTSVAGSAPASAVLINSVTAQVMQRMEKSVLFSYSSCAFSGKKRALHRQEMRLRKK